MKTKMTLLSLSLGLGMNAQTIADFESFTLAPNAAFSPSANSSFQTVNATFEYQWDNTYAFWSGGFAYTNKQDSITGTFQNLYGVRALKGYTTSATYIVGQDNGTIRLKAPFDRVDGFYITNTTYAYKAIVKGNAFSRKFGDTTGTHSPTTMAQGSYPDYFKVVVRGYKQGILKPDSAEFYLADYRFSNNAQDYAVDTWKWFNTSSLGSVDSIRFLMRSSDAGSFGINTPAFFAIDNFSTSAPNPVSIALYQADSEIAVYPNPFNNVISVLAASDGSALRIKNLDGQVVFNEQLKPGISQFDFTGMAAGIYLCEINSREGVVVKKLIKQ